MMRIRTSFVPAALVLILTTTALGQEPIRFARLPDISPDGKHVAFSYLGDIWIVETIGGIARPVTMHQAHDTAPVFSPDGQQIAFSSNRHGSYDVFVVPVQGGKPKRLTFDSASDMVSGWSPDGKQVLFTSTRSTAFPPSLELYTVPVEGGAVRRVTACEGKEGVYSPKGDQIAYVRGPGTWYRKGYRGSSNDDVWICSADGSNNRRLTSFDGQDNSPMWSADGQTIYYVSDCFGDSKRPLANIVKQDAQGKSEPKLVTTHQDEGVRRARISGQLRDGSQLIVYECGPDIWVASTKEGVPPRNLAIEANADDKANTEAPVTFTRGATEFALNKEETHVAFVVHGEIFLQKIGPNSKAVRLTNDPAYDHAITWAPDGKSLLFASDRDGSEHLYLLQSNETEHPKLIDAHTFKTTRLTDKPDADIGASFTADGKRIAFVRAGKLWTMNADGSDQKLVVNEGQVIDYEWSPNGKWICFARLDGNFASELYIVPSTGGTPRNITRYATYNTGVTWSQDGKKIAFLSERRRSQGLFVMSLQRPAVASAPSSDDIDWDDIHLRVEQPVPLFTEEGAISPDGSKIAFRAPGPGGRDLWLATTDGHRVTRLTTGNQMPRDIRWSKRPMELIYYLDNAGQMRMARPSSMLGMFGLDVGSGPPSSGRSSGPSSASSGMDASATIPFKVKITVRRDEEYQEMFEQSWRALRDHFYDNKFHGTDWYAIRAKYRPLVKHVAMKEDLYALISLMVGELNASHLGINGFLATPEETTADLGLLFDDSYRGPGLKVAEILKRGPADKRGINIKAGDIIVCIDGGDLATEPNVSKHLNDKAGETVGLQVLTSATADPKDPKARRRVEIVAANRNQVHDLMYERWVDKNAKRVAELSKGKLGYIHIPSMDETGLDHFVRALYSDNFDKEAIVLDVRYNGGGFTHDQVLNYLGGKEHTVFRQRDGGAGPVLRSYDRKWTKPLVLLINNRSYSDAEIFPSAFRTLGLGKLVGQSTGAHVIGTSAVRLIDGSVFRIPRTGVFNMKGENMERVGVTPDVAVETHPDQLAKGQDAQLDKAVEVLTQDVAAWKKKTNPNVAASGDDGKSSPTPTAIPPSN
jgi:tricorn protease